MKAIFTLFASILLLPAAAQDSERTKELEQKVKVLEERIAMLESQAAKKQATPEAEKMAEIARRHSDEERKKFPAADIEAAEKLYHKASKMLSDDESKPLLDTIVARYPGLNRAGCAQLYRAQQEHGEFKERLLKDCIDRFYDCYYFDGAQVGPLAKFQLANYYRQAGNEEEARKLFRQLRKKHPEAVGHNGRLLIQNFR